MKTIDFLVKCLFMVWFVAFLIWGWQFVAPENLVWLDPARLENLGKAVLLPPVVIFVIICAGALA